MSDEQARYEATVRDFEAEHRGPSAFAKVRQNSDMTIYVSADLYDSEEQMDPSGLEFEHVDGDFGSDAAAREAFTKFCKDQGRRLVWVDDHPSPSQANTQEPQP